MAPEVLKGEISLANPAMDIWSVGMMMFMMLYGFHPFQAKEERFSKSYDLKQLVENIKSNDAFQLPKASPISK